MVFSNLGYEIKIWETPYHAFLEVFDENGQGILIESTDPAFGVVSNAKKIEKRKKEYLNGYNLSNPIGIGANKIEDGVEGYIKEINLKELAGLQYYNDAILAFNRGDYNQASITLKKASYLYPSPRIVMLQMLSDRFLLSMN